MSKDREMVDNTERGCGYLKEDNAYIRADVGALGTRPPFVEFEQYIPNLEVDKMQGYTKFPGIQFELSVDIDTIPEGEIDRHIDRIRNSESGIHVGEMLSANAYDLLMWAGKSHYPEPGDFIKEAKKRGINKGISWTKNNSPPTIYPGNTRVFILHPRAVRRGEDGHAPGIIGYSYVTRYIYVAPPGEDAPKYIKDAQKSRNMNVVEAGPEFEPEDENQEVMDKFR